MSHTISLRLPDNLYNNFDKLCHELDRPKSYILKKAIEKYIDDYFDYDLALERLNDKDDSIISSSQMRETLGL